jgi:hypothetical protein
VSSAITGEQSIHAAAKRYARRYGADAADYARRCAAAMLFVGNVDGWLVWSSVIRAIEEQEQSEH